MKRVLSGIQPTGILHLGNYLGAISNWVNLQNKYDSYFCIVDLHAITLPQNPIELKNAIRLTAATYIASGIDITNSTIFIQSSVSAHSELAWILSCITPLGWLNRMTQFKEKAGKAREQASLGLYSYPVLMAADILVYKAQIVPVGEDQTQHLELTRDVASAFNRYIKEDYFPLPEALITKESARIMSLRDGTKKMSKSDSSDYSRINLTDNADLIAKKLQKAKSDAFPTITYDKENRPEATNLINIYSILSSSSIEKVIDQFSNKGFAIFKKQLTDLVIEKMKPITTRILELIEDKNYIDSIIKIGNEKANDLASKHLSEIKSFIGLG
ncbi:Tryptophan--tRNA ligase [Rickettsiales bacterium Ac37b]|nr:Tryptophan--tRNA ligase [Rickettsiales bacterium Ac37b]